MKRLTKPTTGVRPEALAAVIWWSSPVDFEADMSLLLVFALTRYPVESGSGGPESLSFDQPGIVAELHEAGGRDLDQRPAIRLHELDIAT